ncbi:MAG: DUF362 domain-containing protein [Deltaproteobacteria bacterium]|nr:MAG: DUF362 domain-containing protein [Deltaproteobacteria bacterium]
MPKVNRREFLKLATVTAGSLYLPLVSSCGADSEQGATAGVTAGVVRGEDIIPTVRRAIELASGLDDIKGGDRVVIKPNLTGPVPNAYTKAEVLQGVIQAVAQRTEAKHITLAECSALGLPTEPFAEQAGYLAVCQEEGANFLGWETGEYVGFHDPDWKYITEEKRIPRSLDPNAPEYDHFINVPILKNHEDVPESNAVFTACIKSFVGILPFDGEGSRSNKNIHDEYLGFQAAELGRIVPRITMNVIDATTIVLKNGPAGALFGSGTQDGPMVTYNAGLILASRDRVVCDSLGLAVLRRYARENGVYRPYLDRSVRQDGQISRAAELNLGVADPGLVRIYHENVDDFDEIVAEWS